ncbi:MAG: hypothetical protein NZM11_02880 [Anaerolineales bacterium]|nr:hypothetical protein [Anaerolineales bacterium]
MRGETTMLLSRRRRFTALAIVALLLATLSCGALTDVISQNPTMATAQAIATEAAKAGELFGTAQAMATEISPDGIAATVQAMATQALSGLSTPPPDIPIVEGVETENVFAMENLLSYSTSLSFAEVVAFYKKAMPDNGWEFQEDGSIEMSELAVLNFTRADRDAVVNINVNPADKQTVVSVVVNKK